MRKRITAFLLAGIMFFASGTEVVSGARTSGSGEQEIVKEQVQGDMEEGIQARTGGLKKPVAIEVEGFKPEEIYRDTWGLKKGSAVYNSRYDKYSTNFYYNKLNKNQQTLWDRLDTICNMYLVRTTDLSWNSSISGYITLAASVPSLTEKQIENTLLLFIYSNPQYYFVEGWASSVNYSQVALVGYDEFASGTARAAATQKMFAVVDNWIGQINSQSGDLLKEKKAHDLICENVGYDNDFANDLNQSAYSTFVDKITVCAGYSQAMQLLMNGVGIDCGVVTSQPPVGIGHEWNIIKLNNSWYYVDLTWDDMEGIGGLQVGYQYFNRSRKKYEDGSLDFNTSDYIMHLPETYQLPYMPELTRDSGATYKSYGSITEAASKVPNPVISISSGGEVVIKQPSSNPSGVEIYYAINAEPSVAFHRAIRYTEPFTVKPNVTVYAVATKNGYLDSDVVRKDLKKCTVKLNANGGYFGSKKSKKTKSKSYLVEAAYENLDTPRKKGGYVFLGWFTKKSGGRLISSTTKVKGNITLYAHWTKIKPKKATISRLKSSKSRQMTVVIKKISTSSGYQIKYSLKKNMKSAKTRTVPATASNNTYTITGLKKGKTYYVQVRMYQKDSVSGRKKYGAWSDRKQVKIKK